MGGNWGLVIFFWRSASLGEVPGSAIRSPGMTVPLIGGCLLGAALGWGRSRVLLFAAPG
jgi:hypothetical protein